jgi:hypothetical protein
VALWADQTQRDDEGYLMTGSERFQSSGYAVTSESIDAGVEGPDWLVARDVLGKVRLRASAADGADVFVGIGPTSSVTAYLDGFAHDEVREVTFDPFRVEYRRAEGGAPQSRPAEQGFWAVARSGPGEQTLTWKVEDGDWSLVVMNADASEGVAADVSAGAELGFLTWLALGLLIGGGVILLASGALPFFAVRGAGGGAATAPAPAAGAGLGLVSTVYPVAVHGDRDPELSRWLWLVKWLLALPHYVVLAFLWVAFVVLSVIAFFSILFTGRYPRGMF